MTKILVIEDDLIIREEISDYLNFSNYDVATAENGAIGVEKAIDFEPDLIICDVMMPELDGYGVLLELRSMPKWVNVPFIFLTARVEKQDFRHAMQMGADDYLTKPFNFQELMAAIESRLRKKQTIEEQHQQEMDALRKIVQNQQDHNVFSAELLSMISHDMKTPLTTIVSSASVIRNYFDRLSEEKLHRHAEHIIQATYQTLAMLEDLMAFGKLESGVLELTTTEVLISQMLKEMVATLMQPDRQTHQISIELGDSEYQSINADERLMRHAILNLLSNAIKYSPAGSEIQIIMAKEDNKLRLSVIDQGIGIPQKDLENLFQIFQRATNVGTVSGSGLGLAVVKLTADLHGGTVECQSQEGVGSTFTLSLPLQQAP